VLDFFEAILQNKILIGSAAAWLIAQLLKTIIYFFVNKKLDIRRLMGDGGMPSGHSATVTALAVMVAWEYGPQTGVFAISAILAIVVMHDAMGVRQESGKHAKAINELFELMGGDYQPDEVMKELLGHTPLQVVAGACLGILVACCIGYWW